MAKKAAPAGGAKAPAKKAVATKAPASHPNAIDVSSHPMGDEFQELVRLWVNPEGAISAFIRPRLKEPELFGAMLAQAVRQGARAYAGARDISEEAALERIWTGIDGARAPAAGNKD